MSPRPWEQDSSTKKKEMVSYKILGLRSADSLQLAAALIACGNRPAGHHFLTGDQALKVAAGKEGFLGV